MIEPATGRLNGNGWEPFFRFVLDPKKAWSDTCAVRIPRNASHFFQVGTQEPILQTPYKTTMQCMSSEVGRNLTNVWLVNNSRKGNNHFAAYPETLVERPIALTCPEWLVSDDGIVKPRTRIIDQTVYSEGSGDNARMFGQYSLAESAPDESKLAPEELEKLEQLRQKSGRGDTARHYVPRYPRTVGWTFSDKPVISPGIVLDPFGGTGTTGYVAIMLGRRFIGIDLYGEVAQRMVIRCKEAQAALIQRCPAVAIKVGSALMGPPDMPASEPL